MNTKKELIEDDIDYLSDIVNFKKLEDLKIYLKDRIELRKQQLKKLGEK